MTRSSRSSSHVAALAAAVGLAWLISEREAPAEPTGAELTSPAGDSAPPGGPAPLESFAASLGSTPVPTAIEWRDLASEVKLTRRSARAAECHASRVREWLRIRCKPRTFAISLLGGSNEGLAFWIGREAEEQFGEVQFPMRRGDRRVIQLWRTTTDARGMSSLEPAFVVQEHWTAGEAAPTVTVL